MLALLAQGLGAPFEPLVADAPGRDDDVDAERDDGQADDAGREREAPGQDRVRFTISWVELTVAMAQEPPPSKYRRVFVHAMRRLIRPSPR